ncbi:MAG: hypothetical protein ACLVG7_09925 [Negativibacillus sp.]|nr:hypothetical protein [Clostridium sp.]
MNSKQESIANYKKASLEKISGLAFTVSNHFRPPLRFLIPTDAAHRNAYRIA